MLHRDCGRDDGEVGRFKTGLRTTVHGRLVWEIREKKAKMASKKFKETGLAEMGR